MAKITYEVQEEVGAIVKRWKAVTYELDSLTQCWNILTDYQQEIPNVNYRIVKVEKKESIVDLDDLRKRIRKI